MPNWHVEFREEATAVEDHMANFGPLLFSILSLLLLANMIIAAGSGGGGSGNGNEENERPNRKLLGSEPRCSLSLHQCRDRFSNYACCKAIDDGIRSHGCSCVCKVLINNDKAATLITSCSKTSWCPRCEHCVCSTNPSPPSSPTVPGAPGANSARRATIARPSRGTVG